MFMNVFDVTQTRLTGLINSKNRGTAVTDRRSNNKQRKFTNDHQLIHQHVNSIPRDFHAIHVQNQKSNMSVLI